MTAKSSTKQQPFVCGFTPAEVREQIVNHFDEFINTQIKPAKKGLELLRRYIANLPDDNSVLQHLMTHEVVFADELWFPWHELQAGDPWEQRLRDAYIPNLLYLAREAHNRGLCESAFGQWVLDFIEYREKDRRNEFGNPEYRNHHPDTPN